MSFVLGLSSQVGVICAGPVVDGVPAAGRLLPAHRRLARLVGRAVYIPGYMYDLQCTCTTVHRLYLRVHLLYLRVHLLSFRSYLYLYKVVRVFVHVLVLVHVRTHMYMYVVLGCVAGMNSIVIYLCHEVFHPYFPVQWSVAPTHAAQLAMNLYGAALWTIVAAVLYYKSVFIAI